MNEIESLKDFVSWAYKEIGLQLEMIPIGVQNNGIVDSRTAVVTFEHYN